mmetsp:Transcript_12109/g.34046  ORF Transcript_12109/g.34046 Transcript_12109/m.34046 type:complete len:770 (+) Transcript_12109:130-2439(+)
MPHHPLSSKVVSYFYDDEIGNYCYGGGNPMRPHRVRLTHTLVENYDLIDKLKVQRPIPQSYEEIAQFHADEYVEFLNTVTPDNQDEYLTQLRRFNLGPAGEADCPVFDGLFEYCQIYSGGSVNGAATLSAGEADICLNWSGGMHHAKKAEASGFCYINDIVLGILELLKTHQRVLYVDIDIHHGDGVEEAFYLTDRVMTVSFHKYGDFFPGTGAIGDIGYSDGKYYSLNVPLQEGMDDESYRNMFEPIMQKVMEMFQPGAVVVCGGADSLSGDRLGCFNLSLEGHSNCIEFLARFNVPMMVLGGGGYTMRNVARCWAYETGRLQGMDLPDKIPDGALTEFDYYMDTHTLRIATSNMKNGNTKEQMEKIKEECLRNLSKLPAAPSATISARPPLTKRPELPEEDMDERGGGRAARENRVNKFAHDSEEDQPEEGINKHRGGRDYVEAAVAPTTAAVKQEPQALPRAPEAMDVDQTAASKEEGIEAATKAGAIAEEAMPDAKPTSKPPAEAEVAAAKPAEVLPLAGLAAAREPAGAPKEKAEEALPLPAAGKAAAEEGGPKPHAARAAAPALAVAAVKPKEGRAAAPQQPAADKLKAGVSRPFGDGVKTGQGPALEGAAPVRVEAPKHGPVVPPAKTEEAARPPGKTEGPFKVTLPGRRDPSEKGATSKVPAYGGEQSSRSRGEPEAGVSDAAPAEGEQGEGSTKIQWLGGARIRVPPAAIFAPEPTKPTEDSSAEDGTTTVEKSPGAGATADSGASAEKKSKVKIVFNSL